MHRFSSTDTQGRKHITPADLENMVKSVKENQELEPLSPLPTSLALLPPKPEARPEVAAHYQHSPPKPTQHLQPSQPISAAARAPESSTSTMATQAESETSDMSPRAVTAGSPCTEISSTSIVRGFSKDQISRSNRSRVQLAPLPQPILKASPLAAAAAVPAPKKKGATFVLGGSSGEGEESSFESRYTRSSLADGLRRSNKTTSFKEEIISRTIQDKMYESEEAIDDSDDMSESAIEDDDEDWEDDNEQSQAPTEEEMFQRVESSTNLTSRRSLISTMMHEKDRASALQNAASRSSPTLRRSRTASHNGPLGSSPKEQVQLSRARPIILTTSNTHDTPALSPRTNRRNMLSTELTGSLRKHLLWERQHKTPGAKALKNRQYKSEIRLSEHTTGPFMGSGSDEALKRNESFNYFDTGLQEYHEKGW